MRQVYEHYDRRAKQAAGGFLYCPHCRAELVPKESGQRLRPTCPACGFIQFKNPAPTVSIVVVKGEQVLLGKRRGSPGAGKWGLPSGYIEFEDDFLTTAIQEMKEETGLDVEIQTILSIISSFLSPGFHFLSIFLLAQVVGGELTASDDLEEVAWFPLAGPLPEMAFQEDIDIIEAWRQGKLEGLPVATSPTTA